MGIIRRKIKSLLVVFFLLSLVMVFLSILFPSEVVTSKWIMIGAQKKEVLTKLNNIDDWAAWNDILIQQENIQTYKKDSILNKGDSITWGQSQQALNIIRFDSIRVDGLDMDIQMGGDQPVHSGITFSVQKDSVLMSWYIIEKLKWYPWEKIYGMMAADMKGPALQHSLSVFKEQLDN
ncbi:MAG: hypothetical protein CK547_06625 [Chitinophagaceae bacterium]|nr:MAG: hypothetical protein CK547_06625 [Chitinophagaceae bacterium]